MSYTFLAAAGAESSAECFAGIERFARLNTQAFAEASYCSDSATAFSRGSQFGTMCEPSTLESGAAEWMSSVVASRVSVSRAQLEATQLRKTSGRKCSAWLLEQNHLSFLPKMFLEQRLRLPRKTSSLWVTNAEQFHSPRKTWVATTFGDDIGFLATPTATANQDAPSMMKHPGCRAFVRVFGKVTAAAYEWLMGWPPNWTALEPLEMDKFQSWRRSHGASFLDASNESQ